MVSYKEWCEVLKDERLPAVVVDLDAFDRNLKTMANYLKDSGKTLRLATKSIRVPELIQRALSGSSLFKGVMCFSAEEAEVLSNLGIQDLLIAYPTVQSSDLAAIERMHSRGVQVSLVIDSEAHLKALSEVLPSGAPPFAVVLDVDASLRFFGGRLHLGVRRSPLRTPNDVERLLARAKSYPKVKVVGAMEYEAQVAGLSDQNPFKKFLNPIFKIVRSLSVRAVAKNRVAIAEAFKRSGVPLILFNGGGTGSLNFAAEESVLTELSAGSGLLCSHLFDYYSNVRFEPACFFALQAVRASDEGYITCQGGGYVASGEPGWDKVPRPYLPEGLKLLSGEACGEVQTPLILSGANSIALGAPVLFRHAKAGELAERFQTYLLVSQREIISRAKTYRGLGLCFF